MFYIEFTSYYELLILLKHSSNSVGASNQVMPLLPYTIQLHCMRGKCFQQTQEKRHVNTDPFCTVFIPYRVQSCKYGAKWVRIYMVFFLWNCLVISEGYTEFWIKVKKQKTVSCFLPCKFWSLCYHGYRRYPGPVSCLQELPICIHAGI